MRTSQLFGQRLKEEPAGAVTPSHRFLLKGGYIQPVAGGLYSLLLPAVLIIHKLEAIIREEMNRLDGQEVLFPMVLPGDLWKESGRFDSVGDELARFTDRNGRDMVLGMTHEEAAVHLARSHALSYPQYPFMIYQIQRKFRDEPRPRAGLIRVREFTMKDAYSFHTTQKDLEEYYGRVRQGYHRIFSRAGIPEVIDVGSDSGMMGGSMAHEFMLLSPNGEDTLVLCPHCGYRANMEAASFNPQTPVLNERQFKKISTPNMTDISSLAKFMGTSEKRVLKACVFQKDGSKKPVVVFLRGDLQVNESKLSGLLHAGIMPFTRYEDSRLCFGYLGPVNRLADEAEYYFDRSLEGACDLVCGANEAGYHFDGVSVGRDCKADLFYDLARTPEGAACPVCGEPLQLSRGIEVGNIFQLGTMYTESMDMTYTGADAKPHHPVMGCYGIGVERLLACVIESHHDDYGPIWPLSVAPWQVEILVLNGKAGDPLMKAGEDLYQALGTDCDVLLDDRSVSAGSAFADADLLGAPLRVVFGRKNFEQGLVEITSRDKSIREIVPLSQGKNTVLSCLSQWRQ